MYCCIFLVCVNTSKSMIHTNPFFDPVDSPVEQGRCQPWQWYVKSVFIVHVGGTRDVTSRTDNIMKIHARITLKVEFIRGYIFIFLLYV